MMKISRVAVAVASLVLASTVVGCSSNKSSDEVTYKGTVGDSATTTTAGDLKGVGLHNKESINVKYNLLTTEETQDYKVYFYKLSSTDATITDVAYLTGVTTVNNLTLKVTGGSILIFECEKSGTPELVIGSNSLYDCTLTEDTSITDELDMDTINITGSTSDIVHDSVYDESIENGKYLYDTYTDTFHLFVIGEDKIEAIIDSFNSIGLGQAKIEDKQIGDKYKHYTITYVFKASTGSEHLTIGDSIVYTAQEAEDFSSQELQVLRSSLVAGELEENDVAADNSDVAESEIETDEGV
jgi:hypothetical protein